MPREQIPTTLAILTWSWERAGLSLAQATFKFPRIAEWEHDQFLPSYAQLEQLADALKMPSRFSFFPELPSIPPIHAAVSSTYIAPYISTSIEGAASQFS